MDRRATILVALTLSITLTAALAAAGSLGAGQAPSLQEALVTVHGILDPADVARLEATGMDVLRVFPAFGVAYVTGTGPQIQSLDTLEPVAGVVANDRIELHLDTETVATRARDVWDTKSTSTPISVDGSVVDGSGVGVAVVDTGVETEHPDLAPAVAKNLRFVCPSPLLRHSESQTCYAPYKLFEDDGCGDLLWVDASEHGTTDTFGHGTHVAGIVAGRGTASDGRYVGAAPGATLYGLNAEAGGATFVQALESFNWIHCHHDQIDPAIRVVTNSWGTGDDGWDPDHPLHRAVETLVRDDGLTVLFSAGNAGGAGTDDRVNSLCKAPFGGVICVASYDDQEAANRSGTLADHSSRGLVSDGNPYNWPDLAAPGASVVSTCARLAPVATPCWEFDHAPMYASLSGTSMATPHVAGIAALLLQADPSLTPSEVEEILECSATPFPVLGDRVEDPTNARCGATHGTHHGAGHGLVDACAALALAGAPSCTTEVPQLTQEPHIYTAQRLDIQFQHGLQWTQPAHGAQHLISERFLASGGPSLDDAVFRFRVDTPSGSVVFLPANVSQEADGTLDVNATYAFPEPGEHWIESQVKLGPGEPWRAWDRYRVSAT